ncbi:sigma-70 family RNA polymerase sigma factor [Opitutales bacterium ASA1]|uniref:RNA polymerase sigma factor n=1 Tax=Congregicoccus parvus TaxID=3081749 RepID=UPI002B300C9A|nr:sigma-70 family RNA polymerase sigma factor [Opitutales bacterium ASA1]
MTDPAEFEAFMRSYQNMVYSTAFRLTANHAEAQDIAQEVFLKAYERYDSIRDQPTVGGWLRTVATNLALNHLSRYRKRWSFFSDLRRSNDEGEEGPDFEATIAAPDSREAAGADHRDTRELLEEALAKLPPLQRAAIVLYHFEEMPYQDIASKLRVSLAKVKTDILRGREALKKRLAGRLDELDFNPST